MGISMWKSMHAEIRRSYADSMFISRNWKPADNKGQDWHTLPSIWLPVEPTTGNRSMESILQKGCDADGETWGECLEECNEICYEDPVLKDQQWSAYIDRSPGAASYSEECFHACVAGCSYKFDIPSQKVDQVNPNRPKPPPEQKPPPPTIEARPPSKSSTSTEDILSASA